MLNTAVAEETIGTARVRIGWPELDQVARGPDGPLIGRITTGDGDHIVGLSDFGFAGFNQAQRATRPQKRPVGIHPGGIPQPQAVLIAVCREPGPVVAYG